MKTKIKILIVEDTPTDRIMYQDAIKELNEDQDLGYEIDATFRVNKVDGLIALGKMQDELDGAFIDLRLSTETSVDNSEGNEIVKNIYGKLRFPIVVLTNTPGSFDGNLETSAFLQLRSKDESYINHLKSVIDIHKTGITKILGKTGLIEDMLVNIFWKNISVTLPEWLNVPDCEKHLLRYTLTHFQEHLEISDEGDEFNTVLPIENYIKPTIKKYFYTGDIIKKTDGDHGRYIILTPACDLAPHGPSKTPKATHIILAEIEKYDNTPFGNAIKKAKKDATTEQEIAKKSEAKIVVGKFISNNSNAKYYYLPDTSIVKGGLINFQKLTTVKIGDLSNYEPEATITSQFVKDIIAKFSFYYSRQGSPDFDFQKLISQHLDQAQPQQPAA